MDIPMALRSIVGFISLVLLLVPVTGARYLIESASPTSAGLIPICGISPRPTLGPRRDKLLQKLQRRADSIISPAPSNWCGFIDGDYGESGINIHYSLFSWNIVSCFVKMSDFSTNSKIVLCLAGSLPRVYFHMATQNAAQT